MTDFLRCLMVASVMVLSVGCGPAENDVGQESGQPFAGVQLRIAAPAGHDFATRWQIELDEWSARSGATAQVREYETPAEPIPLAGLLGLDSPDGTPTLVLFPMTRIAELAAQERLATIPEDVQSAESLFWTDFFAGLRDGPARIGGRPAVVPLSAPVLVCYYRRDLFEREGLAPAQTWEEYQTLLEALAEKNLVAVEPYGRQFRATMFLARAVCYAKHPNHFSLFFDIESGAPLIDGPGFVRALEETGAAVRLMSQRHDVTRLSPADCRRLVLSGEAAMAVTLETGLDQSDVQRSESISLAVSRLPGSPVAYNRSTGQWEPPRDEQVNHCTLTAFGGLCAGTRAGASKLEQAAAWNLLSQLSVEPNKLVRLFPPETRSACRESHLSLPPVWVGESLSGSEARQYLDAVARSLRDTRLVAELPVAGRARFHQALSEGIGRFFAGEASANDALHDVARQWRNIAEEIGPEQVLGSYRVSLGLSRKQ